MENVIKHLLMIQNVIDRMANNSFLLKGWSVVLISALFVLMKNQSVHEFIKWLPLLPLIAFWSLDGYFLRQERLYRKLYDTVRQQDTTDFSMNASIYEVPSWTKTCLSTTLIIFYCPIALLILTVNIIE